MSEGSTTYLDAFPSWLQRLGEDAATFGRIAEAQRLPEEGLRPVIGALSYLLKSLDLIPDGIDDIGYLDDAFVFRVAAAHVSRQPLDELDSDERDVVERLAADCELIREFLGETFERLDSYVQGLRDAASRGRSVQDVLDDAHAREELVADVKAFTASYTAPGFGREEKNLIKLRAFFDAKLPG